MEEWGDKRRARRLAIHWPTTVLYGDRRQPCTIEDVSRTGARVRLSQPVAAGSRVTFIDDRVGVIEASVAWCKGDLAGVAFRPETSPAAVAKLRAVLGALEEANARTAAKRPAHQFGRRGVRGG